MSHKRDPCLSSPGEGRRARGLERSRLMMMRIALGSKRGSGTASCHTLSWISTGRSGNLENIAQELEMILLFGCVKGVWGIRWGIRNV